MKAQAYTPLSTLVVVVVLRDGLWNISAHEALVVQVALVRLGRLLLVLHARHAGHISASTVSAVVVRVPLDRLQVRRRDLLRSRRVVCENSGISELLSALLVQGSRAY